MEKRFYSAFAVNLNDSLKYNGFKGNTKSCLVGFHLDEACMTLYFSRMHKKRSLPVLFSCLLLVACAQQLSPGGGPEDKAAPEIKMSIPAPSSLNVSKESKIEVVFSEWIAKKTNNLVSIYPPLKHKISINKNRLQVIPLEALSDSQTYHVIISSNLQDLHGNSLPTSYSLVFSTGSSLDSGVVTGCIIDPVSKNGRYQVALFRNERFSDSGYNASAAYKIESDTLGKYQFDFIKSGRYRALAYINASPNAKNEVVFTPVDSVITISHYGDTVNFYRSRVDTAFPVITSIKGENRTVAFGVWSKIVDSTVFNVSIGLYVADTLSERMDAQYIPFGSGKQFGLLPAVPFSIAQWRCIYSVSRVFDTVVFSDTVVFNSTDREDTLKPVFKSSFPTGTLENNQTISLVWSEPVMLDSLLFLADTLGDTVYCKAAPGYRDTSVLTMSKSLQLDALYMLYLFDKSGHDISGNHLKAKDTSSADTVAVLKFRTLNSDSMAVSISGEAECVIRDMKDNKKWFFELFGKKNRYVSKSTNKETFFFDSLPSGMGAVSVFNDKNGNGQPDQGLLIPWRSPEPFITFTDTVEARARWEVEDIKLRGCRNCFENPADTTEAPERSSEP